MQVHKYSVLDCLQTNIKINEIQAFCSLLTPSPNFIINAANKLRELLSVIASEPTKISNTTLDKVIQKLQLKALERVDEVKTILNANSIGEVCMKLQALFQFAIFNDAYLVAIELKHANRKFSSYIRPHEFIIADSAHVSFKFTYAHKHKVYLAWALDNLELDSVIIYNYDIPDESGVVNIWNEHDVIASVEGKELASLLNNPYNIPSEYEPPVNGHLELVYYDTSTEEALDILQFDNYAEIAHYLFSEAARILYENSIANYRNLVMLNLETEPAYYGIRTNGIKDSYIYTGNNKYESAIMFRADAESNSILGYPDYEISCALTNSSIKIYSGIGENLCELSASDSSILTRCLAAENKPISSITTWIKPIDRLLFLQFVFGKLMIFTSRYPFKAGKFSSTLHNISSDPFYLLALYKLYSDNSRLFYRLETKAAEDTKLTDKIRQIVNDITNSVYLQIAHAVHKLNVEYFDKYKSYISDKNLRTTIKQWLKDMEQYLQTKTKSTSGLDLLLKDTIYVPIYLQVRAAESSDYKAMQSLIDEFKAALISFTNSTVEQISIQLKRLIV